MRIFVLSGILLTLSGCLGPVSLHRAVIEYDRTVTRIDWEMLLLNVARLRDGLPVHFTVTEHRRHLQLPGERSGGRELQHWRRHAWVLRSQRQRRAGGGRESDPY